eukprot:scaffold15156_cov101-Isochrysis_galbana.AAC.5
MAAASLCRRPAGADGVASSGSVAGTETQSARRAAYRRKAGCKGECPGAGAGCKEGFPDAGVLHDPCPHAISPGRAHVAVAIGGQHPYAPHFAGREEPSGRTQHPEERYWGEGRWRHRAGGEAWRSINSQREESPHATNGMRVRKPNGDNGAAHRQPVCATQTPSAGGVPTSQSTDVRWPHRHAKRRAQQMPPTKGCLVRSLAERDDGGGERVVAIRAQASVHSLAHFPAGSADRHESRGLSHIVQQVIGLRADGRGGRERPTISVHGANAHVHAACTRDNAVHVRQPAARRGGAHVLDAAAGWVRTGLLLV